MAFDGSYSSRFENDPSASIVELGFATYPDLITSAECNSILKSLPQTTKPVRAGVRHLMSNPVIRTFASDQRLLSIARSVLGEAALAYRATLFEKTGRSNWLVVWHQDTALPLEDRSESHEWGPWSVKEGITYAHAPTWALERVLALRLHLDDSTPANGPLKVIPCSHKGGVLTDEQVFELSRHDSPTECLVERGGIIAMRPLLIHSSSKCEVDTPRRVIHIEYADSLDLAEGLRLAIS